MLTFHRAALSKDWKNLPNRNFYIDLDFLERLIARLVSHGWSIVTVEDMLHRIEAGESGAKLVNFSIDDCYRDTWELVVPMFRRLNVPVTLFVTTGIPDGTMPLGWAGLETILRERDSVSFEGASVRLANAKTKRAWFARISSAWDRGDFDLEYRQFCRVNGVDADAVAEPHAITWSMLESLRDDPLVEIGSHTVSHQRISALPPSAVLQELEGSRDRLKTRLGVDCRHFAFPYGRAKDCGPRDFEFAREAGFASAATTCKGLVARGQNPFGLPRNTLNGAYQSMIYADMLLRGWGRTAARITGRV